MKKQMKTSTNTLLLKFQKSALAKSNLSKIKGGGSIIIEEQIQG